MSKSKAHIIDSVSSFSKWDDYKMLIKLRLSILVVFTSVIGYIIAAGGAVDVESLIILGIAGMLVTGAANAINQVLEKDHDILMERTKNRPVAAGRMTTSEAVLFAGISCLLGVTMLALFNPLASVLGMLSFVSYSFVYTPLKRYSTISVAVGAIPGALPVLIGYTAYSAEITVIALGLFAIQFLWQFPHFWSIGFLAFKDYRNAGYKLLPEQDGKIDRNLGLYSTLYACLALAVILLLWMFETVGMVPTIIGAVMTTVYILTSIHFQVKHDRKSALLLMFSSFIYLPVVLIGYLMGV